MTIEEGIRAYLTSSPLPLAVGMRVYSQRAPAKPTTPYIVFSRIAVSPLMTHYGAPDTIRRTIQFSVFAATQSEALGIADALRKMLDGYKGLMGSVAVRAVFWRNEQYFYEDFTNLHHVPLDFEFQYVEQ